MPVSRAQVRLAHEVLEGKSDRMPRHVAQEIVDGMQGKSMHELPERVHPKKAAIRVRLARPRGNPRDMTTAVRRQR